MDWFTGFYLGHDTPTRRMSLLPPVSELHRMLSSELDLPNVETASNAPSELSSDGSNSDGEETFAAESRWSYLIQDIVSDARWRRMWVEERRLARRLHFPRYRPPRPEIMSRFVPFRTPTTPILQMIPAFPGDDDESSIEGVAGTRFLGESVSSLVESRSRSASSASEGPSLPGTPRMEVLAETSEGVQFGVDARDVRHYRMQATDDGASTGSSAPEAPNPTEASLSSEEE